jgi:hypothetical protein
MDDLFYRCFSPYHSKYEHKDVNHARKAIKGLAEGTKYLEILAQSLRKKGKTDNNLG